MEIRISNVIQNIFLKDSNINDIVVLVVLELMSCCFLPQFGNVLIMSQHVGVISSACYPKLAFLHNKYSIFNIL